MTSEKKKEHVLNKSFELLWKLISTPFGTLIVTSYLAFLVTRGILSHFSSFSTHMVLFLLFEINLSFFLLFFFCWKVDSIQNLLSRSLLRYSVHFCPEGKIFAFSLFPLIIQLGTLLNPWCRLNLGLVGWKKARTPSISLRLADHPIIQKIGPFLNPLNFYKARAGCLQNIRIKFDFVQINARWHGVMCKTYRHIGQ